MGKILIFLLSVNCLWAQIERDKALHFLGGNLFGLAGAGMAKEISGGDRLWTFVGAVAGSAIVGVGKEALDAGQADNRWDNEDLLATVLGGVTIGIAVDLLSKGKAKRKKQLKDQHNGQTTAFATKLFEDPLISGQWSRPPALATLSLSLGYGAYGN